MTLIVWIRNNWRTISYFVLFFGCVGFASVALWRGWDNKTSSGDFFQALSLGIIASMLASGVLMLFITYRDSKRLADINVAVQRLAPLGDRFALGEIEAVLRNVEVKPEMWVTLLTELETDLNPVYFVGSSLKRWRDRHIYSRALIEKLRPRMERAKKSHTKNGASFETYFCVKNPNAIEPWNKFIRDAILHDTHANLVAYGIHIILFPDSTPYSAVCSSRTLVVTPYTANRNVDESLSIFLRTTGSFYNLYVKDIQYSINLAAERQKPVDAVRA